MAGRIRQGAHLGGARAIRPCDHKGHGHAADAGVARGLRAAPILIDPHPVPDRGALDVIAEVGGDHAAAARQGHAVGLRLALPVDIRRAAALPVPEEHAVGIGDPHHPAACGQSGCQPCAAGRGPDAGDHRIAGIHEAVFVEIAMHIDGHAADAGLVVVGAEDIVGAVRIADAVRIAVGPHEIADGTNEPGRCRIAEVLSGVDAVVGAVGVVEPVAAGSSEIDEAGIVGSDGPAVGIEGAGHPGEHGPAGEVHRGDLHGVGQSGIEPAKPVAPVLIGQNGRQHGRSERVAEDYAHAFDPILVAVEKAVAVGIEPHHVAHRPAGGCVSGRRIAEVLAKIRHGHGRGPGAVKVHAAAAGSRRPVIVEGGRQPGQDAAGVVHHHHIAAVGHAVETIESEGIGRVGRNHALVVACQGRIVRPVGIPQSVAVGVHGKGDGHAADAGFAGILLAIGVEVHPHAVARAVVPRRRRTVAEVGIQMDIARCHHERHRGLVVVNARRSPPVVGIARLHVTGKRGLAVQHETPGTGRTAGELIVAVGVGERGVDGLVVGRVECQVRPGRAELHGHSRQAGLLGILHAVAVGVDPHAVAEAHIAAAAGHVRGRIEIVAEVGGQVLGTGRDGHGIPAAGLALIAEIAVGIGQGSLHHAGRQNGFLDADTIGPRGHGETITAAGIGEGAGHFVAAGIEQADQRMRNAALAGILQAVAVLVQPHEVPDDRHGHESEVDCQGGVGIGQRAGVAAVGILGHRTGAGCQVQNRRAHPAAGRRAVLVQRVIHQRIGPRRRTRHHPGQRSRAHFRSGNVDEPRPRRHTVEDIATARPGLGHGHRRIRKGIVPVHIQHEGNAWDAVFAGSRLEPPVAIEVREHPVAHGHRRRRGDGQQEARAALAAVGIGGGHGEGVIAFLQGHAAQHAAAADGQPVRQRAAQSPCHRAAGAGRAEGRRRIDLVHLPGRQHGWSHCQDAALGADGEHGAAGAAVGIDGAYREGRGPDRPGRGAGDAAVGAEIQSAGQAAGSHGKLIGTGSAGGSDGRAVGAADVGLGEDGGIAGEGDHRAVDAEIHRGRTGAAIGIKHSHGEAGTARRTGRRAADDAAAAQAQPGGQTAGEHAPGPWSGAASCRQDLTVGSADHRGRQGRRPDDERRAFLEAGIGVVRADTDGAGRHRQGRPPGEKAGHVGIAPGVAAVEHRAEPSGRQARHRHGTAQRVIERSDT